MLWGNKKWFSFFLRKNAWTWKASRKNVCEDTWSDWKVLERQWNRQIVQTVFCGSRKKAKSFLREKTSRTKSASIRFYQRLCFSSQICSAFFKYFPQNVIKAQMKYKFHLFNEFSRIFFLFWASRKNLLVFFLKELFLSWVNLLNLAFRIIFVLVFLTLSSWPNRLKPIRARDSAWIFFSFHCFWCSQRLPPRCSLIRKFIEKESVEAEQKPFSWTKSIFSVSEFFCWITELQLKGFQLKTSITHFIEGNWRFQYLFKYLERNKSWLALSLRFNIKAVKSSIIRNYYY